MPISVKEEKFANANLQPSMKTPMCFFPILKPSSSASATVISLPYCTTELVAIML